MLELLCSMRPTALWNYAKTKKELIKKEITFTEGKERGKNGLYYISPFTIKYIAVPLVEMAIFTTAALYCHSYIFQTVIGLTKLLLVDKTQCLKQSQQNKKIKPTENGYSSLTDAVLGIKQKPRQLKITEVMNNAVNCSEIF